MTGFKNNIPHHEEISNDLLAGIAGGAIFFGLALVFGARHMSEILNPVPPVLVDIPPRALNEVNINRMGVGPREDFV